MRNRLTEYAHSILHKRLRHAMMSLYEWEGPMERYQIQSKDCLLQVYACGRFDRGIIGGTRPRAAFVCVC